MGGIIALILILTGFDAASLKAKADEKKIEESTPSETLAQKPEEASEDTEEGTGETLDEETETSETEAAKEPKAEETETAEAEAEEKQETEASDPAEAEEKKPEETEAPAGEAHALGPEGKPLTVLAETAKVYKSFKTLNREKILHVRTAPDINSEIIARLSPGTEGLVLEVGDHWSRIRSFDGTITGYCSNEYLTFTDISPEEFQRLKKDM